MIVLVGKTCSGKTTVANILQEYYNFRRIKTYTTRPPRENEGEEYHFVSDEEFEQMKVENKFFETTQYEVASGDIWKYGTAKSDLCADCCIIMNPDGVKKVRKFLPDEYGVKIIYLNVTEGIQWNRLKAREKNLGQDMMPDEASRRVKADEEDFVHISEYYDLAITTDEMEPLMVANLINHYYEVCE